MNELFSGVAQVSIQGERVLRFLDFTGNQAKYEVIGFEDSPITLIDYRANGLLAIRSLLETGNLNDFAPKFNHPALVKVTQDDLEKVIIELHDTEDHPNSVLWIAIGLGELIPVYDYIYENIAPLKEENKYGLIAVYQIPSFNRPASSSRDSPFESSSSSSVTWVGYSKGMG